MGDSAGSTAVKCVDQTHSSRKLLLIFSLCLGQILQSLTLSSPWLSFRGKIKCFVQVVPGWFSFLRWGYEDTLILSRQGYWQMFPTRLSQLAGSHPCYPPPIISLCPQGNFHLQTTDTRTKQVEEKGWWITEQIIHNECKVLIFQWEICGDDYSNWYQKMLCSMVPN